MLISIGANYTERCVQIWNHHKVRLADQEIVTVHDKDTHEIKKKVKRSTPGLSHDNMASGGQ